MQTFLSSEVIGISRSQHFSYVAPIHTDLVDRTIGRITAELGVYTGKEARKLAFAHFARGHGEFTVLDAAQARNVAINLHVIRRVGKNEFGLVVIHQQLVSRGIGGITADQDVLSKHPDITQTADRRSARLLGHLVFRLLTFIPDTLEDDVDLGGLETRQEHIEAQIDKALQLDCEELVIPSLPSPQDGCPQGYRPSSRPH